MVNVRRKIAATLELAVSKVSNGQYAIPQRASLVLLTSE